MTRKTLFPRKVCVILPSLHVTQSPAVFCSRAARQVRQRGGGKVKGGGGRDRSAPRGKVKRGKERERAQTVDDNLKRKEFRVLNARRG